MKNRLPTYFQSFWLRIMAGVSCLRNTSQSIQSNLVPRIHLRYPQFASERVLIHCLLVVGLVMGSVGENKTTKAISDEVVQKQLSEDAVSLSSSAPELINYSLKTAIQNRLPSILPGGTYFVVGNYQLNPPWVVGTLAAAVKNIPPDWENFIWFIGYQANEWSIELQGTEQYDQFLYRLPLDFPFRPNMTLISPSSTNGIINEMMKFPWDQSQKWTLTTRWHDGNALDFAPNNVTRENAYILAASSGIFKLTCNVDGQASAIVQNNTLGDTKYVHLDRRSIPKEIENQQVEQGRELGLPYNGASGRGYYDIGQNWPWPSCAPQNSPVCNWGNRTGCCSLQWINSCGAGNAWHLHWALPIRNMTVEACNINDYSCQKKQISTNIRKTSAPELDSPPTINFLGANNQPPNNQTIQTNQSTWTFSGSANDDKSVDHVDAILSTPSGTSTERASGTTNWTFSRTLNGKNRIFFRAYDDRGQVSAGSNYIDLLIDTAAPNIEPQLSGSSGRNDWYTSAVQIRLTATDNASGHWKADVANITYRVDGGTQQTVNDTVAEFSVNGDGYHSVEFSARDKVGNISQNKVIQFKIDATPPTTPATPSLSGVASGAWQSTVNTPLFTWSPAVDPNGGSGTIAYRVEWTGKESETPTAQFTPGQLGTGSYTLRVRAVDLAGNISQPSAPFVFNYDGNPPAMPIARNNDNVANGVWQNHTRTASFAWDAAADSGSGTKKYYVYWGSDPAGTTSSASTGLSYANGSPIVAADSVATWYLRTRSEDGVGLRSEWTSYALRYDGAKPTVTLNANYGLPVVSTTNVHLTVDYSDQGSGVDQMRFSIEGANWSDWQSATNEIFWQIPNVGKRSYAIYAQVKDSAGNLSTIISDSVTLNVQTANYPQSSNFFLWNSEFTGGSTPNNGGILSSPAWQQRVTLGLNFGAPDRANSASFLLNSGLQAAALSIPTAVVTPTTYLLTNQILAGGGSGAGGLTSASWKMHSTIGQSTEMAKTRSTNFVASLGYWGTIAFITNTVVTPPPPITETVTIDCPFYSLSVDHGALFTDSPQVMLDTCGPNPSEMMFSNDGGFANAVWQPYTHTVPWSITTYGSNVLPRVVYARYRDAQGGLFGPIQDDIIYDPNPPLGRSSFDVTSFFTNTAELNAAADQAAQQLLVQTLAQTNLQASGAEATPIVFIKAPSRTIDGAELVKGNQAQLYLSASDDTSGVAEMQVSLDAAFVGANWQPFTGIATVSIPNDGIYTVHTRFRDHVGNLSTVATSRLLRDTTSPKGSVRTQQSILGPNALAITLQFSATDSLSGVSGVRVSRYSTFTDTLWLPYSQQMDINISYNGETEPTLYAQFRDGAGNESTVVQTRYQVDIAPPTAVISVTGYNDSKITLQFNAQDDLSGMKEVWLTYDYEFITGVVKLDYVPTLEWDMQGYGVVNMRFVDKAGNISETYWWGGSDGPIDGVIEEIENKVYLPVVAR